MRTLTRNCFVSCVLLLMTLSLRADQLQMQNGDHYAGKILSMTSNSIVFESDVLGKVTLPQEKVSAVTFGANATSNAPAAANMVAATNSSRKITAATTNVSGAAHALVANSNSIEHVRQQMLTGADPAASQKYNELVGGLMSGKLGVGDIRNEAKSSIEQIYKLKRELGPEADASLDTYLAILQSFVNETSAETPSASTAAPAAPAGSTGNFGTNAPKSQGK
jgi:hypothetical protein